jgi:hypothetical protein
LHVGAESAARNGNPARGDGRYEGVEQPGADFGWRSAREARAQASAGVGRQRELRHQEQSAADVSNGPIHFPRGICKHAIRTEAGGELGNLGGAVTALDSDQHDETEADIGHFPAFDLHFCACDTLN